MKPNNIFAIKQKISEPAYILNMENLARKIEETLHIPMNKIF